MKIGGGQNNCEEGLAPFADVFCKISNGKNEDNVLKRLWEPCSAFLRINQHSGSQRLKSGN